MKRRITLDDWVTIVTIVLFIFLFFHLTSCTSRLHCPPHPSKAGKVHQKLPQPREVFYSRKMARS